MASMKRLLVTAAALPVLAFGACHGDRFQPREPSNLEGEEGEVIVETLWDEEPRSVIEIPDLLNPYEDDFNVCGCCCASHCGDGLDTSDFEAFIIGLKDEVTAKAAAAAEALIEAGPDLVRHEGWKDMAGDAMDILGNPILVVVQLPSGQWRKAAFEALPDLDVDPVEAFMIRKSVGNRLQAALKAAMEGRGLDEAEADAIAGKIIKAYLTNLSP
jgi:hypothetical protein